MATPSSILENPMNRGVWQATVHGVAVSDTTEVTQHTQQGSSFSQSTDSSKKCLESFMYSGQLVGSQVDLAYVRRRKTLESGDQVFFLVLALIGCVTFGKFLSFSGPFFLIWKYPGALVFPEGSGREILGGSSEQSSSGGGGSRSGEAGCGGLVSPYHIRLQGKTGQ